jgi:hypothetical protein
MSGPDQIDGRFDELVRELRSGEATASPELRQRVRAIAEGKQEPKREAPATAGRVGWFRRHRLALVLVPVAAALAAAVGIGAFSSGSSPRTADGLVRRQSVLAPTPHSLPIPAEAPTGGQAGSRTFTPQGTGHFADSGNADALKTTDRAIPGKLGPSGSTLAPSGSRAQLYEADLALRVNDLSGATKQAIQLTRAWGGYVVSVDYGSGQKSGTAQLELRVPIVKVQTAVAKLTSLGTIIDDHVSIQDVQGQLNQRYIQIQDVKAKIAKLRADLAQPNLTTSQKAFFQAALAQRIAQLTRFQQQQQAQQTRASFATVWLDVTTKKAAAVVPSKPGRIGQALHNIGHVLVTELEVLLYVLLIGAPFIVLAALLWGGHRAFRRRSEEQLLAR